MCYYGITVGVVRVVTWPSFIMVKIRLMINICQRYRLHKMIFKFKLCPLSLKACPHCMLNAFASIIHVVGTYTVS